MKARFVLCGLLMTSVVGCGDLFNKLTEDEVPHFKTVDGKVAIAALGATIGEVTTQLNTVLGQTGSGLNSPTNVTPPDDLFKEEDAAAAAPGFKPASEGDNWSEWRGPEVGPDGIAGWYYREVTSESWSWEDSKWTPMRWRYWLRFEPAHDIKAEGVKSASATHTNYAWTGEEGTWWDWKYVIRFGVTSVGTNLDGTPRPAAVEGTWLWEIGANAPHYRGSKSEGEYNYVLGNAEHVFGSHDEEDEEEGAEKDPFDGLAVGQSRDIDFTGSGTWSYTGQHADYDNEIAGSWYGAGEQNNEGSAKITRTGESTADANIAYKYQSRGYWGQGVQLVEWDFTQPPAFAKDVTPAGDAWGIPKWYGYTGASDLTPRDGLLYWNESNGDMLFDQSWDVLKAMAANAKRDAAYEVIDDPEATQEARQQAYEDIDAANDELETAYTKRNSQFRNKYTYRTWNGMEMTDEYVSCSSPDLAPDCPADENQQK